MKKISGVILTVMGLVIGVMSIVMKLKEKVALSLPFPSLFIRGEDGPTAIFIAGKIGNNSILLGIMIGVILFLAGLLLLVRKK